MFFWDPTFILILPALVLALWAQNKVRRAYAEFSRVPAMRGRTGAEVATEILRYNGITDVSVEETEGMLSDHYDPRSKTLRLSTENYRSRSIAAVSVAAHEVGHAIQHAQAYAPLQLRHAILPVSNIGSTLAFPLFIIGLFVAYRPLMDIGILLFSAAVVFQLVTLPVEFNASHRALKQLETYGLLERSELPAARKVLSAAALTYVAATAMAVLNLVRLLILRGMEE